MNEALNSIRQRLTAWNLLILTAILLVVGSAVYAVMSRSLMDVVDRSLAARAETLVPSIRFEEHDGRLRLDDEVSYFGGGFYLIVGPDGQLLANPQRVSLPGNAPPLTASSSHFENTTIGGESTRLLVQPLQVARRGEVFVVVGESIRPQQDALRELLLVLVLGGVGGLALSVGGAWFLSGRALVPIHLAFRRQQQFVADASHELRTPLTVIHASIDILNRHRTEPLEANGELIDDVSKEIGRMERLVSDLLTLARSDLGEFELATGVLDLSALADDVARLAGALAAEHGVSITRRKEGKPPVVEGDPDRLQQVLLILLDNAIRHTPPGGVVTVTSSGRGSSAWVEVSDTGEGIPAEHLPRIFDRFYRADKARARERGGTGLGLAIAKSLVEAHGGQLNLESATGKGTTARSPPAGWRSP